MRTATIAVIVAAAFVLAAGAAFPRTWYVNPDGTGDAPTIPAAAESCAYGDTILARPGTYVCPDVADPGYYSWLAMPSGVSLVSSAGPMATVIIDSAISTWSYSVIDMSEVSDCLVRGFTIKRGRYIPCCHYIYGVDLYRTTDCAIDSCIIEGYICGIQVSGKASQTSSPMITNCDISVCASGIACYDLYPEVTPNIEGNQIYDCYTGIDCRSSAPTIRGNRIEACRDQGINLIGCSPATVIRNLVVRCEYYGLCVATDVGYEPNLYSLDIPGCGNSLFDNGYRDLVYYPYGGDYRELSAMYTYWGSDCPEFEGLIATSAMVVFRPWANSTHSRILSECPQATEATTWGAIKAMYR